MKKYTLLFVLFMLLISVRIGFCQTCDCEVLQNEIDNLNMQIDILKGYRFQIENDNLISFGDYEILFKDIYTLEDKDDKYLSIFIQYYNNSNKSNNFENSIGYRFFENGIELDVASKRTDRYIKPGANIHINLVYKLHSSNGVIECDLWSLDNPDIVHSSVIYNLE